MPRISSKALRTSVIAAAALAALGGIAIAQQDRFVVTVPDGISFSEFRGYDTWQTISVSQNNDVIDVILGNPEMIAAYKSGIPGNGKPFPDGAKMVKIHWKTRKLSDTFPATVPDTLHDIDTMVRDSKRFKDADHWGYSQFNYDTKTATFSPLGKGSNCGRACHGAAAKTDYVFTQFPVR